MTAFSNNDFTVKRTYKVITHNGIFHPDELFAIALLKKYFCNISSIVRTRDEAVISAGLSDPDTILVDIGFIDDSSILAFDHHQGTLNKKWVMEDGSETPYSATGLVFDFLAKNGYLPVDKNGLEYIKKECIIPIDAADNGFRYTDKYAFVFGFNRKENNDSQFLKALEMVESVLENVMDMAVEYTAKIEKTVASVSECVVKVIGNRKVVLVDTYNNEIDTDYAMKIKPDIDFFITKRDENVYCLKTAPITPDEIFPRKNPVPEHFINLKDKGLDGILNNFAGNGKVCFLHKAGFFSVVEGDFNNATEFALSIVNYASPESNVLI